MQEEPAAVAAGGRTGILLDGGEVLGLQVQLSRSEDVAEVSSRLEIRRLKPGEQALRKR